MIYIDNLSAFVRMVIDRQCDGVLFPQNKEYVNTTELAQCIAQCLQKRIWVSRLLGVAVRVLSLACKTAKKAFSTLIYVDTEDFNFSYCVADFEASVQKSCEE